MPNNVAISSDKEQFNIYIPRELRNRLEELAAEFNKGKATKVAAEIVEIYIERWAKLEAAKRKWLDEQEARMLEILEREETVRSHPPIIRTSVHKTQGRKKTK